MRASYGVYSTHEHRDLRDYPLVVSLTKERKSNVDLVRFFLCQGSRAVMLGAMIDHPILEAVVV